MTLGTVLSLFVLPAVLFAFMYFPAVNKLSRSLVSPYAKADVRRRLFAATVDGLLLITAWVLYRSSDSAVFLVAGAAYLLLRDAMWGRSVGKLLFGLTVVNLTTGLPCSLSGAVRRNALLLLPGANLVAVFFETVTIVRDPQGQRLGDRLALTQVVDGLGAKDVATAFREWWSGVMADLVSRRPDRGPVGTDN